MRRFSLAVAAFLSSIPLAAAPAALPESAQSAHHQKALVLAQTVQPPEIAVDAAMIALDRQIVGALLADADVKKLESDHPGAVRAMWDGAKPLMHAMLEKSLPDLWRRLADVYDARLTDEQIEATTRFFRSPAGRKFLLQANSQVDFRPMIAGSLSSDGKIAQQNYLNTATSAAIGAYQAMSESERAEIDRFFTSDAGHALAAAAPDVARTGVEWMNKAEPGEDGVQDAMKTALVGFLRQHP